MIQGGNHPDGKYIMSDDNNKDAIDSPSENNQLVLISGESATGKSASFRNWRDQEDTVYLGTEAGKRLPFRNKFKAPRISDPYQVMDAFDHCIANPEFSKGLITDSATFLMDMYESQYVLTATNTMKAWSDFAQFWKVLLQKKVVEYNKPVVFTAHTLRTYDEKSMDFVTAVPVKGSLKNNGLEAYFSTVVSTKKVSLKDLEKFQSDLLTITDEEEMLGFKYCFQTRLTKTTLGERIRSPMGMFAPNETFMDNDAQLLMDRLTEFYK